MEVNQTIPSLVNGVSQQAPELRHDTSVDEMINCTLSMTEGTRRRNSLITQDTDNDLAGHTPFIHTYERGDGTESYIIVIIGGATDTADGIWKVYDVSGSLQDEGTDPYLSIKTTAKASESFSVVTVGDTTFIVNKTIEVEESGTKTHNSNDTNLHKKYGYYWIKRTYVAYSGSSLTDITTYSYTINSHTSPDDSETGKDSNAVATYFDTLSGSTYEASGSMIRDDITSSGAWITSDSWGDQASQGWHGVIKKLQDLPNKMGWSGVDTLINVTGDESNKFEGFWAYYDGDSWQETAAPGISLGIDATTMPHTLARVDDTGGSGGGFDFTFGTFAWEARGVGDDESNAMPSFVGSTIEDVFFHKNRLGFLSGDNVILSEIGIYENFFRTTVTDLLATDPIDVAVDTNTVASLKYAVPFNQNLVIFGTHAQYILSSTKELAPDTASVAQTTSYTINQNIVPKSLGPNVYFAVDRGDYSQVREYFNVPGSTSNEASDITSHIPTYIPSDLIALEASSKYDMVFALPPDGNTVYVYNQQWEGESKSQSAWHKWNFTGLTIFNIKIVEDNLLIMADEGSDRKLYSVSLSSSDFSTAQTETFTSEILLNEWGFQSGGNNPVDDKQGKLQIRKIDLEARNGSKQDIEVTVNGASHTASNKTSSLVVGDAKKTTIKIKSRSINGFCIDSINLKGRFNSKTKTV